MSLIETMVGEVRQKYGQLKRRYPGRRVEWGTLIAEVVRLHGPHSNDRFAELCVQLKKAYSASKTARKRERFARSWNKIT